MLNNIFLLILCLFGDFRGFRRPCEAMRRVIEQKIKVKFWIQGPRTVYYNTTCAEIFFPKSLHPNPHPHPYSPIILHTLSLTHPPALLLRKLHMPSFVRFQKKQLQIQQKYFFHSQLKYSDPVCKGPWLQCRF